MANIYPITSFFRALLLALAVTAFSSTSWALDVTDLDVDTPVAKQSVESAALESANEEPKLIAAKDKSGSDDVNDPIESFNRGIFAFNEFFWNTFLSRSRKATKRFYRIRLSRRLGMPFIMSAHRSFCFMIYCRANGSAPALLQDVF